MIEPFQVALFRHACCWLLIALGLEMNVPGAGAAGPDLLDYLQACGIGDEDFAKFADDRQIADEELDVIRRIALRLRDCPTDQFQRMTLQKASAVHMRLTQSRQK